MNITVIPDIHADMQRLNWSLNTSSASSELFFLGDLIDAGKSVKKPNDLGVLKKVRELISTGKAKAVLGFQCEHDIYSMCEDSLRWAMSLEK